MITLSYIRTAKHKICESGLQFERLTVYKDIYKYGTFRSSSGLLTLNHVHENPNNGSSTCGIGTQNITLQNITHPNDKAPNRRAVFQESNNLQHAALLTLSMGMSSGPQRSIVMEKLRANEDGVTAWKKLVQHFERSTKELRLDTLLQIWENEGLRIGEHRDELIIRLSGINAKLEVLGAGFGQPALNKRFIAAIEKQQDHVYSGVLQQHRGMLIRGSPYTLDELREFLAYVHTTETKKRPGPAMEGLVTILECKRCGKRTQRKAMLEEHMEPS